jgi:REP element-mobilizing transposase RayT
VTHLSRYNPGDFMDDTLSLPQRRSIRLQGFDYSQPGAYFITICAHGKRCIFGKIVSDQMKLNAIGRIVNECWLEVPRHFPNVELESYVVMPNHVHLLFDIQPRARHAVRLPAKNKTTGTFRRPVAHSVPTIVRSFKSAVSKRVRQMLQKPAFQVWQRNYYESVLCDGREFRSALHYIMENPARWHVDEENPQASTAHL